MAFRGRISEAVIRKIDRTGSGQRQEVTVQLTSTNITDFGGRGNRRARQVAMRP